MHGVVHRAAHGLVGISVVEVAAASRVKPAKRAVAFDNHNGTTGSHGKL